MKTRRPSDVILNSGEGLRAAYYVDWDPASLSSLKQHIHQIDLLFTDWLHVVTPDGTLVDYSADNTPFEVIDANGVHDVDLEGKVARTVMDAHEDPDIVPMVSNFNPTAGSFEENVGAFLKNASSRARFENQVDRFFAVNSDYRGLSLDFEQLPVDAKGGYRALISELFRDFTRKKLRLYINVPMSEDDADLRFMSAHSDGLLLMDYDEHEVHSGPGPIAEQDWFVNNLKHVLDLIPRQKLICSIGSYGYDWTLPLPAKSSTPRVDLTKPISSDDISTQEVWQLASRTNSSIELDGRSLNPHFAYDDLDDHVRHQVWFLDAVTALNEMRAAHQLGIDTFALWRLGSEDRSLWKVWDSPMAPSAPSQLQTVLPGDDVITEGDGDILRVVRDPQNGKRSVHTDDQGQFITNETMEGYPLPYSVRQYGYHPHEVALTFDDGPDPTWTPKILSILKQKDVIGTFLMIGEEAQNHIGLMREVYREGHEIGSHSFSHPDLNGISQRELDLELNLTERLFASTLGVQPLYFRPPYSIDQEPDTNDEARPADHIEKMGYIILGDKIDTSDWKLDAHKTPQQIVADVFSQLGRMQSKPQFKGSVILMHDGGGDRSLTIATLPLLIDALRAHGYAIVPVSQLIGKTRAQVMPPLKPDQRWQARVDSLAFYGFAFFNHFLVAAFIVGDVLMSVRLLLIGVFALMDRLRNPRKSLPLDYRPFVAVLVPAFNEEKVIADTVRSLLESDYPKLRVIVIDDGSTDRTGSVIREAYQTEIAQGLLTVLTKPNAGKAEALNCGLTHVTEEVYVGIDADTLIAPDAISKLVGHFADGRIGAVAGNARVGNRVNLWTRWQALEYITSQNLERRALNLFHVVSVVPGAIGAWRTDAVRAQGGYHANTVAEDADLTMSLLERGYNVVYEDLALGFTEAPMDVTGLMRQRFRWSFGTLQALFKHRYALLRRRALGVFALPNILVFQILMPILSPLIDLTFVAGVVHYLYDLKFRSRFADTASFERLLVFFLAFLFIDVLTSAVALAMERGVSDRKSDVWLLRDFFLQRFSYRQIFSVVLLKTLKRAFDGRPFRWEKLDRFGCHLETHERPITAKT